MGRPYQVKSKVYLAWYLLSQRYKSRKCIEVQQIIFAPNTIPDFKQLMAKGVSETELSTSRIHYEVSALKKKKKALFSLNKPRATFV